MPPRKRSQSFLLNEKPVQRLTALVAKRKAALSYCLPFLLPSESHQKAKKFPVRPNGPAIGGGMWQTGNF